MSNGIWFHVIDADGNTVEGAPTWTFEPSALGDARRFREWFVSVCSGDVDVGAHLDRERADSGPLIRFPAARLKQLHALAARSVEVGDVEVMEPEVLDALDGFVAAVAEALAWLGSNPEQAGAVRLG